MKRRGKPRRFALALALVMAIGTLHVAGAERVDDGNLSENGGWALQIGEYTYYFAQGGAMESIYRVKNTEGSSPEKIFALETEGTGTKTLSSMAYHAQRIWFLSGETLYSIGLLGEDPQKAPLPAVGEDLTYRIGYAGPDGLCIWAGQALGLQKMPRGAVSVYTVGGSGKLNAKVLFAPAGTGFVQAISANSSGCYYIAWDGSSLMAKYYYAPWGSIGDGKPLFTDYFPENAVASKDGLYYTSTDGEYVYLSRYNASNGKVSRLVDTAKENGLYFNIQGDRLFCVSELSGTSQLYVADLKTGSILSETDTGTAAFGLNIAGDRLLIGGLWYRLFSDGTVGRIDS